ncbi:MULTISPECIES: nuclear transport factor 2 family protein [unclassified Mesorhizobium]|uniref:nuclear transport factor 2 family protein n=1 Tax=unclassified Mesorhizobium TaxID=325217 RepID=UPI000FD2FBFA|nr:MULTISPECIES: nuclear transport factor 2 family protein [unclassified Mesorhizobium]RUX06644.1 nuclear transport factor 2 family protein [Mesorhizobium sp. M8A.F.Ca.ET.023.01.1.1]TGR38506.1 nuclear transport factor 2 family protein [bacterium M00.F.Ca.ET.199.01.1.1]TGU27972.1 nuclear transport factor 2 family protein [bacterium M00.F.Ca.ET.156.01.1.1]TGU91091.1 nuclear transport factor 2 family protein [Mesorhizobium sp. M00.F.Ca.ET.151.01.1.1]TGV10966.1 nuclear transport factor 2 family pr
MTGTARQAMSVRPVVFAAAALLIAIVAARADDRAIISRWYSALLVADRTELSDLLADDVRIKLDDLGVVQSKQEFIASLDEWKGAVAGAAIRHRIEKSEGGVTTVIACYDFPDNDMLMQETFAVNNNRITASSQAAIAENCEGY